MIRIRKIVVRLGVGIVGVLAVACVAAAGLYAAMQTESGRAWMERLAERALSEPDGQKVTLQGLSGTLPQAIRLDRLEIRDADGAWLTASSLVLDWRPWRLLLGEISVTRVSIGEIAVTRSPAGNGQATGLPLINLEIREFAVGKAALASPVLGMETAFKASGHANVRPGQALDVYFDAERSDSKPGMFRVEAAYRPVDDHLILNLQVHESEGGVIAHLLDLPTLPSLRINLHGEGPVSGWRGQLVATATGIAEVQAEATLSRDAPHTVTEYP
jgi:translocation and assembly module TamB